jgi:hypothetical protein
MEAGTIVYQQTVALGSNSFDLVKKKYRGAESKKQSTHKFGIRYKSFKHEHFQF